MKGTTGSHLSDQDGPEAQCGQTNENGQISDIH